jgi:hypothetical protein
MYGIARPCRRHKVPPEATLPAEQSFARNYAFIAPFAASAVIGNERTRVPTALASAGAQVVRQTIGAVPQRAGLALLIRSPPPSILQSCAALPWCCQTRRIIYHAAVIAGLCDVAV